MCECGAVYLCDVTGKNQGEAIVQGLMLLCNQDWELASSLSEGMDFFESKIDHYDIVTHSVVERGYWEGRRISGVLLFIKLNKDLLEELPDITPKGRSIKMDETRPAFTQISRQQVESWVRNGDLSNITLSAKASDKILREIQRLLYSGDMVIRNRAAEALGAACAVVVDYQPRIVQRIIQGLFYSILDTAASPWGAFEAISEIISRRIDIFAPYIGQLYPLLGDTSKRALAMDALVRIGKSHPTVLRRITMYLIPFLKDEDPIVRGLTVRFMGYVKAFELKRELEALLSDETKITFYEAGMVHTKSVGLLAREALDRI